MLALGIAMDSLSIYPQKEPATSIIMHVFPCHQQSLDNATPPGDGKTSAWMQILRVRASIPKNFNKNEDANETFLESRFQTIYKKLYNLSKKNTRELVSSYIFA